MHRWWKIHNYQCRDWVSFYFGAFLRKIFAFFTCVYFRYVLDINGGAAAGNKVITYSQKHGGPNQQWRIESDKTIVSGDTKFVVDIYESRFQAGTPVDVFTKWLTDNQLFELEYV